MAALKAPSSRTNPKSIRKTTKPSHKTLSISRSLKSNQPIKSPHFAASSTKPAKSSSTNPSALQPRKAPTPYQRLTYAHLLCIPAGRITSYLLISRAVAAASNTDAKPSARAAGTALRCNPFAPYVPCHRVISHSGYIGGFKGEWFDAPSGLNQTEKLGLLMGEGVEFDERGMLVTGGGVAKKGAKLDDEVLFDGPWDYESYVREVEALCEAMDE